MLGVFRVRLSLSSQAAMHLWSSLFRAEEAQDGESLVNFVEESEYSMRLLDYGTRQKGRACPVVGVYSSATAEGILKRFDEVWIRVI